MAFIVALTATLGSLFYSEIVGWTPCKMCWYQRILMYPLVIILGIAAMRKDRKVSVYVLPMAIIGGLIAALHYGEQVSSTLAALGSCELDGVACSTRYTFAYDYITIPMMAVKVSLVEGNITKLGVDAIVNAVKVLKSYDYKSLKEAVMCLFSREDYGIFSEVFNKKTL